MVKLLQAIQPPRGTAHFTSYHISSIFCLYFWETHTSCEYMHLYMFSSVTQKRQPGEHSPPGSSTFFTCA